MARMVCFSYATKLAQVLKQHYACSSGSRMLVFTIGHAELAASALYMGLVHSRNPKKHAQALKYLRQLLEILCVLGETYPLADQVFRTLEQSINQWRADNMLAYDQGESLLALLSPSKFDDSMLSDYVGEFSSKRDFELSATTDNANPSHPDKYPRTNSGVSFSMSSLADQSTDTEAKNGSDSHAVVISQPPASESYHLLPEMTSLGSYLPTASFSPNPSWDNFLNDEDIEHLPPIGEVGHADFDLGTFSI